MKNGLKWVIVGLVCYATQDYTDPLSYTAWSLWFLMMLSIGATIANIQDGT